MNKKARPARRLKSNNRERENSGVPTPAALRVAASLLGRASLAERLGKQFGGNRSLYDVLGYKKTPQFIDYFTVYKRQGLGRRIVDAPAQETWAKPPDVLEEKTEGTETQFEREFTELAKRLQLWDCLLRLDRLTGIGRYGVLVLGITGQPLDQPLQPGSLARLGQKALMYVRPFSEQSAKISRWELDEKSPRFGLPTMYGVTLSQTGTKTTTREVHHSRVIHVAEDALEDTIYGSPRLEAAYNRTFDHEKVLGGGAEMFWLGAFRGPILTTKDDYEAATQYQDADATSTSKLTGMKEWVHGLQRVMDVDGYDVEFPPTVNPDPKNQLVGIIDDIAAATGIPKRILLGSERGELSSSQDERAWRARIERRQAAFATQIILQPLIDRLMVAGILPVPKKGYEIIWPAQLEPTKQEKMTTAKLVADAISAYAPGASETVMPVAEFRETVLEIDAQPDEKYMVENPLAQVEEPIEEDPDDDDEDPDDGEDGSDRDGDGPVGNANPNHDKLGKFAPGGGSSKGELNGTVVVFHGTTEQAAKKILKQGLRPQKKRNFAESKKGYVFVTEDFDVARHFSEGPVIKLELPKALYKKMQDDRQYVAFVMGKGLKKQGKMFKGAIGPEHIAAITVTANRPNPEMGYARLRWEAPKKFKTFELRQAPLTLYAPYGGPASDIVAFLKTEGTEE